MQNQSKINFQSKIRICSFESLLDLMKNIYRNKMFFLKSFRPNLGFFEMAIKDSDLVRIFDGFGRIRIFTSVDH